MPTDRYGLRINVDCETTGIAVRKARNLNDRIPLVEGPVSFSVIMRGHRPLSLNDTEPIITGRLSISIIHKFHTAVILIGEVSI